METLEDKLAKLRKLYALARKCGNVRWMKQIEHDANHLKELENDPEVKNALYFQQLQEDKLPT